MTRILIIEDEPNLRATLADLLELHQFSVIAAPNGRSGLEIAKRSHPDLIVCDVAMPEVNGYQVLTSLREHQETAYIPLIFLTGRTEYVALRQGMELGADDYLAKPFEPDDLVRAIHAQIKKRQQLYHAFQCVKKTTAARLNAGLIDELTGVSNLLGLEECFQDLSSDAQQNPETAPAGLGCIFLKIEELTTLQEKFGHVFGIQVLKQVATRLQAWAKNQPNVKNIAYLGSERFALLMFSEPHGQWLKRIEARVEQALSAPLQISNHELHLQLSIASVGYSSWGEAFHQCLIKGLRELSLRSQQRAQRDLSNSQAKTLSSFSIAHRLKLALEREEFELYYQPQVDLKSGLIIGAEVLLRWNSPDEGMISPALFIPAAEESGLILPIGDWVLRNACRQVRQWQQNERSAITLSVNLSAKQLAQPQFEAHLLETLTQEGVSPPWLDLELTESVLIQDLEATQKTLKSLQTRGFNIAVDDFGTGYSSLGYLQHLPINILKIDKCFVRNLDQNLGNSVIVKAIIDMAQGLNITTIAEGVETAEELSCLKQLGCQAMQGYVFSPAISAPAFEKLIEPGKVSLTSLAQKSVKPE
jgi:diguanylate cyclase